MNNPSASFAAVVQLIQFARNKAYQAVNTTLINLYWQIGKHISEQVQAQKWGMGVVAELASYISRTEPSAKGFSDKNLWRMKQFYETYKDAAILAPPRGVWPGNPKLSTVPGELKSGKKAAQAKRQLQMKSKLSTVSGELEIEETPLAKISWSHHTTIISQCKLAEEREFYIYLSIKEKYSVRELQRQINSSLFERVALSKTKPPPLVRELGSGAIHGLKDSYVFEFLNLPEPHTEHDLQKAILQNLKKFLLEFSRDFAFLGEEFTVQVGSKDFSLDLLFFNRALNCLVAIELKVVDFIPEHIGKLNFYLEVLDRDVKKPHENPSIGILLCKAKDDEVVKYSMSRQMSKAMVAQYQLQLPDKKLLKQKLHEFFEMNVKEGIGDVAKQKTKQKKTTAPKRKPGNAAIKKTKAKK